VTDELEFLADLAARLPRPPVGETWTGDDAAVLDGGLLVTTDAMVEGVHFDLAWSTPFDAGWKAVAVSVSDVAAMGGSPSAMVVALGAPPDRPGIADEVTLGLGAAAGETATALVGGDVTESPVLTLTTTVLGHPGARGPVLRTGATPGDRLYVTGEIGLAVSALDRLRQGETPDERALERLLRPVPRVAEGLTAADAGASAMIDTSDGFALDTTRLCVASGVGVRIATDRLPLADGVEARRALVGGDEYELCFTAPDPDAVVMAFERARLPLPAEVGEITGPPERLLVDAAGETSDLPSEGWRHRLA